MNSLLKIAIGAAVGYAAYRIVQNYVELDASIKAAAEEGDGTEEDDVVASSTPGNDDPEKITIVV
jgi:hypothetical protein